MTAGDEPQRRWVLLGASNLTRGLATAVAIAQRTHRTPIDLMAALGNGRSYGWYARLLGRGLPGILDCGLWRDLAARAKLPTSALLTDIGNDVMYGAAVAEILEWVEACLARLAKVDAEVVVTGLPLVNLPRLGPIRFQAFRRLFFPRNRDSLAQVTERCLAVDAGVRGLAERFGATFVEPRAAWYGLDPIHYRRSQWRAAWQEILLRDAAQSGDRSREADNDYESVSSLDHSVASWLRTQFWLPEERWLFGIAQRRRQPSVVLDDATRISLY
ncbi:MAG: hypothetical protein K8U03_08230 [Planctomycetia bacterium]|nr:hypothetical protein [Planctomycetia bacterium]